MGQPPAGGPWWPTFTLVWVCLQGAFGALTVTMKLFPAIVTLHLIGGLVFLALLCVQAVQHAGDQRSAARRSEPKGCVGFVGHDGLAGCASGFGRLGQYQLCGVGMHHLPQIARVAGGPPWTLRRASRFGVNWACCKTAVTSVLRGLTAIHYVHRLMAYVVPFAAMVWLRFNCVPI